MELAHEEGVKPTPSAETKQALPFSEKFKAFAGVEVLENEEVESFRKKASSKAKDFIAPFRKANLITEADETEALEAWENLVALDEEQLEKYGRFQTAIYQKAIAELQESDPTESNKEVQRMILQLKALIKQTKQTLSGALISTNRVNPEDPEKVARAGELDMPQKWIIVNWRKKEELVDLDHRIQAAVYEETAHLISKLSKYKGLLGENAWVEEMMARVIAFGVPFGHNEQDPNYQQIYKDMRASDYLKLFRAISKMAEDDEILINMFLGESHLTAQESEKLPKLLMLLN